MKVEVWAITPLEVKQWKVDTIEDFVLDNWNLKYKVHIELYEEENFRNYFSHAKEMLLNPLTGKKRLMRGFHRFNKKEHQMAVIYMDDWDEMKKVLIHEMVHAEDCELIGPKVWNRIWKEHIKTGKYQHDRHKDPFEIKAYWMEEHFNEANSDIRTDEG
jgi:hypothetical protein